MLGIGCDASLNLVGVYGRAVVVLCYKAREVLQRWSWVEKP